MRLISVTLAIALATPQAAAQTDHARAGIEGLYEAEDGSHRVELWVRDDELHGRIVWTERAGVLDAENPDAALRARPVAGIEHLRGAHLGADGTWEGGTLYNPEDGKLYDVVDLRLVDGELRIRARPRVAVFGRLLGALFGRITYTPVDDGEGEGAGGER